MNNQAQHGRSPTPSTLMMTAARSPENADANAVADNGMDILILLR